MPPRRRPSAKRSTSHTPLWTLPISWTYAATRSILKQSYNGGKTLVRDTAKAAKTVAKDGWNAAKSATKATKQAIGKTADAIGQRLYGDKPKRGKTPPKPKPLPRLTRQEENKQVKALDPELAKRKKELNQKYKELTKPVEEEPAKLPTKSAWDEWEEQRKADRLNKIPHAEKLKTDIRQVWWDLQGQVKRMQDEEDRRRSTSKTQKRRSSGSGAREVPVRQHKRNQGGKPTSVKRHPRKINGGQK